MDDKTIFGVVGTAVGSVGAGLSITELQAIVSIVITISGFFISVVLPLIIKLVKKIKEAIKDGKITEEELKDIVETGKEGVEIIKNGVDEVKNHIDKKEDKE